MDFDEGDAHRWRGGKSQHGSQSGDGGVERRLAQFAFVREERDREVRLIFRAVSPAEVAAAFRATGARLLTIAGERVTHPDASLYSPQPDDADAPEADEKDAPLEHANLPPRPQELTLRYFFSIGESVYTVSIAAHEGEAQSVAGVYPAARAIEDEIAERLGAIFSR
jgi:hypothetical protein